MDDSDHKERRKGTRRRANKTRLLDDRRAGPGRRIWARRAETGGGQRGEAQRRTACRPGPAQRETAA